MACFGPLLLPPRPPPLPNSRSPGGRSPGSSRFQRRRSSSTCRPPIPPPTPLSSTYLSFRDDVEFEEISRPPPPRPPPKPRPQLALTLQRSHSEGNLRNLGSNFGLSGTRTFNKCIRALSGSWKNLLQWHKDKPLSPNPIIPSLILPPQKPPTLHLHAIISSPNGKMSCNNVCICALHLLYIYSLSIHELLQRMSEI